VDEKLDSLVTEKCVDGLQSTRTQTANALAKHDLAAQANLLQEEAAEEQGRACRNHHPVFNASRDAADGRRGQTSQDPFRYVSTHKGS
jgi:hypothetical protein